TAPPSAPGWAGQAMHTASEDVPVPGTPASIRAWVLASVAVTTALTRAASVSGTGTTTSTLIVPAGGGPEPPRSTPPVSAAIAAGVAAAHTGRLTPTVATTRTPSSSASV